MKITVFFIIVAISSCCVDARPVSGAQQIQRPATQKAAEILSDPNQPSNLQDPGNVNKINKFSDFVDKLVHVVQTFVLKGIVRSDSLHAMSDQNKILLGQALTRPAAQKAAEILSDPIQPSKLQDSVNKILLKFVLLEDITGTLHTTIQQLVKESDSLHTMSDQNKVLLSQALTDTKLKSDGSSMALLMDKELMNRAGTSSEDDITSIMETLRGKFHDDLKLIILRREIDSGLLNPETGAAVKITGGLTDGHENTLAGITGATGGLTGLGALDAIIRSGHTVLSRAADLTDISELIVINPVAEPRQSRSD